MSTWVDQLITDYTLITGDGKVYTPLSLYMTWNFAYDFNISKFNFKDVPGTLVKRGEAQGEVYNIEIIFQGADTLDMNRSFKDSSKNKNAWQIYHPFFGDLYVQPLNLKFDNGKLNQTIITGEVMQTILESGVAVTVNYPDAIAAESATVNTNFTKTIAADVPTPQVDFFRNLINHINGAYKLVSAKIANVQYDVTGYANYYGDAINAVSNTAIFDTEQILAQTVALITSPAYFSDNIANRIAMFQAQLTLFKDDVANILGIYNKPTRALKKLYENNAGVAISGMCVAAITNIGNDYNYRPDVLKVIQTVVAGYNDYVKNLYTLQSLNGSGIDSYIPDPNSVNSLTHLVSTVVKALFEISAGALQQRTWTAPYDTNILLVVFELFPDQNPDECAMTLMANNNVYGEEIFTIKKERQLIYYV